MDEAIAFTNSENNAALSLLGFGLGLGWLDTRVPGAFGGFLVQVFL